jgi:hypothetical protein
MRVTEVKYTRRFNMGNYEHEEVTATAVIDDETTTVDAIQRLKSEVVSAIIGKLPPPELPPVRGVTPPVKEVVKEPAPKVKETPKKEPKAKKETPKSGPKPTVKYDRDIEEHKEELGNIFEELHPGWNKDKEVLKRCASISREMVGEYIFAEDGEVLDSFKESVVSKFTVVDGDL